MRGQGGSAPGWRIDRVVWQASGMRFDDVELLRLILKDEETPTGALFSGFSLIQAIAGKTVLDHPNDYRAFAKELLLGREAGLLDFADRTWPGSPGPNPLVDSHQWLQQISNIHLTIPGRDRAQGRVTVRPLPDPDEDDGRLIAGMTLEEIAREIGDTYTADQIPKFLADSGIPPEYVPINQGDSKWEYVLLILDRLDERGSASRRVLREFIGAWLDNRLHTWPEEDARRRILRQLGQQGWSVRDGRLVVGPQQVAVPEPPRG